MLDVGHVGLSSFLTWGAHADERHRRVRDRFCRASSGGEPSIVVNFSEHFRESGFKQWSLAGAKQREFIWIRFDADDIVFAVGKTNRSNRSDVSEPENADLHRTPS